MHYLFSLYSEIISKQYEDLDGLILSRQNVTNLRYVDDAILIAETEEKATSIIRYGNNKI